MHGVGIANGVRFWARWSPEKVSIRFGDRDVTWADFDEATNRVATGLAALGVAPGDRVGILSGNSVEYCETAIATQKLGAYLVPLNIRLAPAELRYIVENSGCAVGIADATLAPLLAEAIADLDVTPVSVDGSLGTPFAELQRAAPDDPAVAVRDDDPAFLCYTSGTTGQPKGAMLTHRNVWTMANHRILIDALTPDDRVYLPFPLSFTGGLVSMWMPPYFAGATLVLDHAVEPGRALAAIARERITDFAAVPVIWEMLLAHDDFASTDLSSLRIAASGGAPVPRSLLEALQEAGIPMSQGYGLTEGAGMNLWLRAEDAERKIGTAGQAMMHNRVRIVGDDGAELASGEVGELVIAGPDVMAGYWDDPEATAATIVDGWLHTGDLGSMDDDGFVTIVDRAKDMLISGGLNVYPAEIERVLAAHPGIGEVAVIGVADQRWGETPAAVICPAPGSTLDAAEITGFCRGQLADYKVPRHIVVRDEPLPRGMSGKVLKRLLREEYAYLADRASGSQGPARSS